MKNCLIVLTAALAIAPVFAQEEGGEQKAAPKTKTSYAAFSTLPFCLLTEGATSEVMRPGGEWEPVEEGQFYPLGSSYRAGKGGKLVIAFGKECTATIADGSSFGTEKQGLGVKVRKIILQQGTVELSLARNLPEGAFVVTAPGFVVKDPAGDSKFVYKELGDGDEAVVRCVTGTMAVDGRHFTIPQMRAADEFRIRTTRDYLETILYGQSGDYIVKLDQGVGETNEIGDDGSLKHGTAPKTLDWHLSPETKVHIGRALPSIGERMSVHTMCFDPAGTLKNECSFCEGRAEVNSGELIPQEKPEGEELAKRAAEAAEETTEAVEDTESENKTEENNENE